MTNDNVIIDYINKLLAYINILKLVGKKRIEKEQSPKNIFMFFSFQEATNSFKVFGDVYTLSLKDPEFFTQLSILARNIHEIFLTFFWIRKEKMEQLFFAYIFKEDNEMLEYYDDISKQTGGKILMDDQIREKIAAGKDFYIDLLNKTKKYNKFLSTKTKDGALFPSWYDIAGRIESLYKKGFFSAMKLGHKNYYRLVSLASHFRPSSVTANIPHFTSPQATSTSKILIAQITTTLMLVLTEEITSRLAYGAKYKAQIKSLRDEYKKCIEPLFS